MRTQKHTKPILALLILLLATLAIHGQAAELIFTPTKIDGPVHDPVNDSYWFGPFCETASVLDADGDGDLDITACRNWYEAPNWIMHLDFRNGAEINGPETESNSEFAMDVNFDGRMDIVSSGWMFMKGVYWYENPGSYGSVERAGIRPSAAEILYQVKETTWPSHKIHQALNMEGVIHGDIDNDGDEDILVNHWGPVEGQGMTWLEHIDAPPWFVEHIVGTNGELHGNALGDINMDSRIDIVTPVGWYEQPERATDTPWKFHADYTFMPAHVKGPAEGPSALYRSSAAHPFVIHDVNEDGLNDIIISSAHTYGLAWLEQNVDETGNRTFDQHFIETEYSVFHTMALGDLNGDDKLDLVIGKRLFAHYGRDAGAFEPLAVFWYDIKGGAFERHILAYNHLPYYPDEGGINPPPNMVIGVGMKINIEDMDHDGDNDVVLAGKSGLYLMENQGSPPTPGYAHVLPSYDTYESWREWPRYDILFNGRDFTGWKVPEGDDDHWKVRDYAIDYDSHSEAEGDKNLWTEEEFCNYDLHLEWRFTPASGTSDAPTALPFGSFALNESGIITAVPKPNYESAILLRGPTYGVRIWDQPRGSGELWIAGNNGDLGPELRAISVPKNRADKPIGDWNSMDITLIGNRVSVMLNREQVFENIQAGGGGAASTSANTEGPMEIDPSLIAALPECGPIGLLHSGGSEPGTGETVVTTGLVQFRNIWIDRLDEMPAMAQADEGEWETLFNGKDLTGWITGPDNHFVVENGELTVKRENMDGREHNLDYLWTQEQYSDFVLELDFKVVEGTNSGIFLRTTDLKNPVYTGIEVQVQSSYDRPELSKNYTAGAIYDLQAPTMNAINPPGEWNIYRLICTGSRIQVVLNGEEVLDMDIAKWRQPTMNPDGTPNKFLIAGAAFSREGHIGLQDHGRPVWYRNIRVKRLD